LLKALRDGVQNVRTMLPEFGRRAKAISSGYNGLRAFLPLGIFARLRFNAGGFSGFRRHMGVMDGGARADHYTAWGGLC
jgi:hypothetical protein